ncbi:hypothetical protein RH831_08615 [Halodesulfurarchaeum sp. HSR-GB]|uniref:DUF7322 domain-containing protein n=1 Tax=Halodesulfurarchaeum sp. HSR-GB TaxID=3074077 RepID=UPI00285E8AF1|nr:hypothetical protein [Halodesulfurarchaeum sp. HSR-GB]MDR5657241.1 hypothetical protein [Halodesulfurarchaeum sp. HSR-GB]
MTAPEVEPDPEQLVEADVPPRLRREFLLQAGLLNVGVLAAGGGIVALGFTPRQRLGMVLLLAGTLAIGLTWWRYRREITD